MEQRLTGTGTRILTSNTPTRSKQVPQSTTSDATTTKSAKRFHSPTSSDKENRVAVSRSNTVKPKHATVDQEEGRSDIAVQTAEDTDSPSVVIQESDIEAYVSRPASVELPNTEPGDVDKMLLEDEDNDEEASGNTSKQLRMQLHKQFNQVRNRQRQRIKERYSLSQQVSQQEVELLYTIEHPKITSTRRRTSKRQDVTNKYYTVVKMPGYPKQKAWSLLQRANVAKLRNGPVEYAEDDIVEIRFDEGEYRLAYGRIVEMRFTEDEDGKRWYVVIQWAYDDSDAQRDLAFEDSSWIAGERRWSTHFQIVTPHNIGRKLSKSEVADLFDPDKLLNVQKKVATDNLRTYRRDMRAYMRRQNQVLKKRAQKTLTKKSQ